MKNTEAKPKRKLPPMRSSLATHAEAMAMLRALRGNDDLTVEHDADAGTARAFVTKHPTIEVFAAIAKADKGPWIVRQMEGLLSRVEGGAL